MNSAEMYTMLPGSIVSYDGLVATVRPSLSKLLANGDILEAPIISNVPIAWPMADNGRALITVPLKPGDPVELRFACRSIENWLSGADGPPDDPRQHDLTDCIATPVMRPGVGQADTENVSVQYGPGSMKIAPDGSLTFNVPTWTVNADMTTFNTPLLVNGLITYTEGMTGAGGEGQTIQITGDVDFVGGTVTHNGINIGSTHKHHENGAGNLTGNPQ